MSSIARIRGGKKLTGSVELIANKNSLLPMLMVSILSSNPITYEWIPNTSDMIAVLDIITAIGGAVEHNPDKEQAIINGAQITKTDLAALEGKNIRASLLFAGPLLARFGSATIPMPGGCTLGYRGIGAHVELFEKVGIKAELGEDRVTFNKEVDTPTSGHITIYAKETSVTATENIMLYAAGMPNLTIELIGAACEPHVTDLANLLSSIGADVKGVGSNRLTITGTDPAKVPSITARPRFDFVDFCGYAIAAAITDGEITIKNANDPEIIQPIIEWLQLFNIDFIPDGDDILVRRTPNELLYINHHKTFPMASNRLPKLYPRPWPGFPVDCIPMMIPLAAAMERGKLVIKNWMYEDGLQVTRELATMGASIYVSSPGEIMVDGKDSTFSGTHTVTPPQVIQSVKAVFLAALASTTGSITTIHNFNFLKRRYPDVIEKYTSLGAEIETV